MFSESSPYVTFPQILKQCQVLLLSILLPTSRAIMLLKVLHKCCNMAILGFYWYIRTLPRVLHTLESHAYISVKPLVAVLQYINIYPMAYVRYIPVEAFCSMASVEYIRILCMYVPAMYRTVKKSKPIINCKEVDVSKIRS